jgi:hypothetical protein
MVVSKAGEGYRIFFCDTKTGLVNGRVAVTSKKWTLKLNDAGSVSVDVPALAASMKKINLQSLTAEKKQCLGISYNGTILECGPIWGSAFDAENGNLTLTGAGLWTMFDRRKNLNWAQVNAGTPAQKSKITITNKTLGSVARELVRISIQDNPAGGLNIVLPADVAGTSSYTYNGFNMSWLGDDLRKLTTDELGPDIRIIPRFNGVDPNIVEWVMTTGTPAQPLLFQSGDDFLWDGTVPNSSVVGFSSKKDGTTMADRAWVPGSGQEQNMLMSTAVTTALTAQGMPYSEVDTAAKTTETQATLDGTARRLLQDNGSPILTFSITVRADRAPLLGTYWPGDFATVKIPRGHPHLAPGAVRVRIMAIDGDDTENVKVTVAPLLAGLSGGAYADRITLTP